MPPLTREQLLEIQARRRNDPDVHQLLLEVRRLRVLAVKADDVYRRLVELGTTARVDTSTQIVIESLAEALRDEPAVQESAQGRAQFAEEIGGRK